MGLLLSIVITYAGFNEAVECLKHIISGIIPDTEPNFQDLVEYYTRLLRKAANPSSPRDWTTECGQGYLYLTEDKDGCIKSAAVKYYGDKTNSTALLFSTKISSFGQDSVEENQANGDYKFERYPTKTKTIISESSKSFSVGNKKISPTSSETFSDNDLQKKNYHNASEDNKHKLTWEYIPKSTSPLPEINFQSYDDGKIGDVAYSENYLRSLDGIKYKPLQRNDPSGRRRSFRKRKSSSSNSSKESRASREEELKMFTSLEEEEFKSMGRENYSGFGSAPNLAARSNSRSRSRERSKEKYNDEPSNSRSNDRLEVTHQRSLPRLGSFEESDEIKETAENELIFSNEYTKAMNKDWHSGHFCCWQCDESLTGQRYVLREEHPYCIKCYESAFANGCEECNKTIGIDSKDLSYKDKHWHEACFLCAKCRVSLVDKQFGSKHDKIYCGNCYDAQFASRCDGCREVFRAGE